MYYGIPLRARRLRRFYSQFVTRGSLCFDVGAHAGNRVRCWRQLGAQVVAIEPQPDFVRLLTWLYGRDRHVTIVPVALGREAGHAELYVSERTAIGSCTLLITCQVFDPTERAASTVSGETPRIPSAMILIDTGAA